MNLTEALLRLCLPTTGIVLGLGLGLLWQASQLARQRGLSWPAALRVVVERLFNL